MNRKIRILATSDVHAYIFPYRYADAESVDGTFSRIKTKIDQLRDENTIVIDNGDTLEGTPLSFYHFMKRKGTECPVTTAMKEIGFDYINLGNHDFDYGQSALKMHIDGTGAELLNANILYQGEHFGKPYAVRTIAGKKIALFGLITKFVPFWAKKENIENMEFLDAFETARSTVAEIKEKEDPDYIICIYHGGFERNLSTGELVNNDTGENQGYKILKEIDGIDVMISGHVHQSVCTKFNGTVVTQTKDHGVEIASVEIDPDTNEIRAELLEVNEPADQGLLKMLASEEDECQVWLDRTIGTSEVDLKVCDEFDARLHKSQMITFLNLVQKEVTGADLSATALFLHATGFERNITMRNLVSTYVFSNTLTVKRISGKILKEYLEQCAKFWAVEDGQIVVAKEFEEPIPMYFNYDMLDGVDYTIKVSNPPGQRIIRLERNGMPVKDDDMFNIAVNNFRASGGGNFPMIRDAETLREYQTNFVDVLAEYIMENKVIKFTPVHNISVIL